MISSIISRLVILVFGTLYPAYASYKAVRTKNLKEYVKWMMYWIVFALFTCTETFTDVFLSWFPFYYEVKIVLVLWLLSPATKGSSILYRKFVHPALCRREQEIDEYIAKAKDQGYHTVLNLGTKGVNYATTVIMQTAIKGGGGLVQQLRKSYSLSDLTECEPREERGADEADDVLAEPRLIRRAIKSGFAARRSASESNSRQPMYFPEVDVDVRTTRTSRSDEPDFSHIKSTEDISSGYSSADNSASLTRTGSVGAAGRARARTSRTTTTITTIKRPQAAEENEVVIEELQDDDDNIFTNMPPLINTPSRLYLSHTNPPFIYQYVGDQVKIIQILGQLPLSDDFSLKRSTEKQKETPDKIIFEEFSSHETEERNNVKEDPETSDVPKKVNVENITEDKVLINSDNEVIVQSDIDTKELNVDVPEVNRNNISDTKTNNDNHISSADKDTNGNDNCNVMEGSDYFSENTSAESFNDNYSSDDEASFGTPSGSPRVNRKLQKNKYGKSKAPSPPKIENIETVITQVTESSKILEAEEMPKNELMVAKPDVNVEEKEAIEHSREIKRTRSKSPLRMLKPSATGFAKLLQLPNKLAFWHKADEKSLSDNSLFCSDKSRSASNENFSDNSQVKDDINVAGSVSDDTIEIPLRRKSQDEISFKDAFESENESTTQRIIDKSDELQKLIVSKIENHPEYKYVSLNNEIEKTSKSTEV
ncbi:uncharacterized protein [Battus philenor]|uniref:uncharacterized protein isoform X2 n=1 Tax=Battus philenor TaxID=42288 RepID=UPI0035CEE850